MAEKKIKLGDEVVVDDGGDFAGGSVENWAVEEVFLWHVGINHEQQIFHATEANIVLVWLQYFSQQEGQQVIAIILL